MPDPQLGGLWIRVTPSGAKSFAAIARTPAGKQVWTTIGAADVMPIAEAREAAREIIKRIRAGLPAVEPKADSFAAVVDKWRSVYAGPKGLRTIKEIERLLTVHILPAWGNRVFVSIRRSDITALLDNVAAKHGDRTADRCLSIFSSIANWHAARVDAYSPPMTRGMTRQSTKEQARDRILDDHEIRAAWQATESAGAFGAIVRLCLLTGQRRTKVAEMRWSDVSIDGEWTIARESAREKDTAGVLMLPEAALAIIRAQPRIGNNPHVFAGRGDLGPFRGMGQSKTLLDAELPAGMPAWVLHDLRRTARSLMSRAGVRPDVAERVLGHAIAGVRGTYDRHEYLTEKADALARLATLIGGIVHPRENIVPMTGRTG